jgi:hypothetical protein
MVRTQQPAWHCIANLGDADPFLHGGQFLMIDRRGIYPAELWVFSEWLEESPQMTLHTIVLDPCYPVISDGETVGLSDNRFHPSMAAWFGDLHKLKWDLYKLKSVSSFIGMECNELAQLFCGNPYDRAIAYAAVADYYGLGNFDSYPRVFDTKREAKSFCKRMLAQIKKAEALPDGLGR